jgi:hypothetical protein
MHLSTYGYASHFFNLTMKFLRGFSYSLALIHIFVANKVIFPILTVLLTVLLTVHQ